MFGPAETVLVLIAVVAGLALVARRLRVPYTILLVVAGLGLGWIPGLRGVGLPPLLYPAAWLMPWREFRSNLWPIALLALGLVVLTMLGTGAAGHWLFAGLPLASAFVLGAIVAPTDPLAATVIAKRMRVPGQIRHVLEGEGLVNDATGLVAYRIAVLGVVTGSFSWGGTAVDFVRMTAGGIAFGLAVGWLMGEIHRRVDDPMIEITLSLLTPFAASLPADALGLSGILAVVSAGFYLGWCSPVIHQAQMRLRAMPVWETIQFILNGLVFLLIGLEVPEILRAMEHTPALALAGEAAGIALAVIFIRIAWVFAASYLPRLIIPALRRRDPLPGWRHVLLVGWTGMRGAVSLAAALGLPRATEQGVPFPGRARILFLTYCAILATLVLQGLSLPRVIRWLGVTGGDEAEEEEHQARLKTSQAALAWLDQLEPKEPSDVVEKLREEYNEQVQQLEKSQHPKEPGGSGNGASYRKLKREAIEAERRTLLQLRNERVINDAVLRRIQHELDLAESRLGH